MDDKNQLEQIHALCMQIEDLFTDLQMNSDSDYSNIQELSQNLTCDVQTFIDSLDTPECNFCESTEDVIQNDEDELFYCADCRKEGEEVATDETRSYGNQPRRIEF
jgi:HPt (histidine-containing phosphotransfer) domain-containing protein